MSKGEAARRKTSEGCYTEQTSGSGQAPLSAQCPKTSPQRPYTGHRERTGHLEKATEKSDFSSVLTSLPS